MSDNDDSLTKEGRQGSGEVETKRTKEEGVNRKRKRGASGHENARAKTDSRTTSNNTIETEEDDDEVVQIMTPVSNEALDLSSSKPIEGGKKLNPFRIPSATSVNALKNASEMTPPLSSPQVSTVTPSPTKKVIQFHGDDSDDSDQPVVPAKRKISLGKLSSPRLSQNSKGVLASPRKVPAKEQLLKRKRELEEERRKLPIWSAREPLLKMIEENQVTILLGETGCGKSTQLPQFLLSKYQNKGIIGITQPRRVAAINLARRVAEEHGTHLRNKVGYSIRFDDATTSETRIKYLTDGMLLREFQSSPNLSAYSVIILDEAHERSLRTDLLMGLIKLILPNRPDLRVIIMSATLDAERFSSFFEKDGKTAQIGFVQGREYPVEVFSTGDLATSFDGSGSGDYVDGALKCILQIHLGKAKGDILVFLTGQNEIDSLESSLNFLKSEIPKNKDTLLICPLYAALPPNLQHKAFMPTPLGSRKIILATNIAETSVTVPGVRFVIDCGLQKRRKFNAQLGIETLQIHPISKSSAAQRAGRAGREAPGKCFRLYPQSYFSSLSDNSTPEIRECDLTSLVLSLKIQGHDDILNFPFLDRPKRASVIRSLELLYLLGALGKDGKPTPLGAQMNMLPLTPELAKVLLSSTTGESVCVAEVIDIIACMSASSASSNAIFVTPNSEKREETAETRKHFASVFGDHITLLQAFREYLSVLKAGNHGEGVKEWCQRWGINRRVLKNVIEIQKQLTSHCQRNNITVSPAERPDKEAILKAFLSGYITNTAFLQMDGSYRTCFSHHTVAIHPSSVLFSPGNPRKIEAILYHELVATTKNYVRGVSQVEQDWFQGVAPGLMSLTSDIGSPTKD